RLVGERKHVPSTALPATTTDASVMPTPTKTAAITSITAATPGTTPATGARSGRIQLSRRYIYAQHVPVGFIDYMPGQAEQAALYAVHADMVGAATVVTDADQRIRWSARYSPTGE